MMDRRDALLLVERLKRRTRDPEVLTLCEYVHGTDVHGTIPAFRRPGDGTPPAVIPSTSCPVCAGSAVPLMSAARPLFPRKRTSICDLAMSHKCHKRL
jgi:hypothetical protein